MEWCYGEIRRGRHGDNREGSIRSDARCLYHERLCDDTLARYKEWRSFATARQMCDSRNEILQVSIEGNNKPAYMRPNVLLSLSSTHAPGDASWYPLNHPHDGGRSRGQHHQALSIGTFFVFTAGCEMFLQSSLDPVSCIPFHSHLGLTAKANSVDLVCVSMTCSSLQLWGLFRLLFGLPLPY